ncbi:pseudoazurin [Cereibacter changlensis]|jgi:pseudoazurin|uniref:Pseudoazurin n=1 Tax=Cereibacter changlensis TaxID=402884 RepID=A0A4U0YXK2_9RHOB|nr:pseudoazurin [Cereibacter changlensis]TKA94651.1 pseudoazurin [Cereibacter changlensis]
MFKILCAASLATLMLSDLATAATFEVKMLNKGVDGAMVFEPGFTAIALGDTVVFQPTDKGHNVETIKGMLPEGAEAFKSKMGEEFSVTFTEEGVYGIKCTPHAGMGMVGLIGVGAPVNLEAARTVPQKGKAKQRFDALFTQIAE